MAKKVQHFISAASSTNSEKAIFEEVLTDGLQSSKFSGKDNQPCFKVIDMRGRVAGPYQSVTYRGQKFYFDKESYRIFHQGLEKNNQTYTESMYQQIMYGPHTRAKPFKSTEKNKYALNYLFENNSKHVMDDSRQANVTGTYNPDILTLGYIAQRKEQRLMYVMPITMTYEGKEYPVRSKDFSASGLKVFLPRTLIIPDRTVLLRFDFFIEQLENYTDDSKKRFFEKVEYKIVNVQHIYEKTYVSLIQKNLNDIARSHFHQFIEEYRTQYKVDANDVLQAAKAHFVQHLYTHNLTSIPLLLSKKNIQKASAKGTQNTTLYFIERVIQTSKNKELVDFFAYTTDTTHSYDFSAFMLPHRLEHFSTIAFEQGINLLFMFWDRGKLHSLCDFEFQNKNELADIVLKVMSARGKVFCINTRHIHHPPAKRIKTITESLLHEDEKNIQQLIHKASHYDAQLVLTDITDVFRFESYFSMFIEIKPGQESQVKVWNENHQVLMSSGRIMKTVSLPPLPRPEKLEFQVHKVRYDPRYIHKMPVILHIRHKDVQAETIDFSKNGVGIAFTYQSDYQLIPNDQIEVSFPEFEKKVSDISLSNIQFKMARIIYKEDKVELGLVRLPGRKNYQAGQFFTDLINKNKAKLDICSKDRYELTLDYLMQAYIDNNINSIPIIVSKDKEQGHYLKNIGIAGVACSLAERFFLKLRGYNFKILTSDERLKEIYTRTLRAHKQDQSFILFMYKDSNEQGLEYINSYTSYEVLYQGETLDLLNRVFTHDGVCIKVSFSNHLESDKHELQDVIEMVKSVNKAMSINLKNELNEIIGFIDLVDITPAYKVVYELQI